MNSSTRINPAILALATACGLAASESVLAQSGELEKTGEQLVSVSVKADTDHVVAGETFNLVFLFRIDPHWHIYWESPGSTGMPTTIDVTAPAGFEVGSSGPTRTPWVSACARPTITTCAISPPSCSNWKWRATVSR